MAGCGSARDGLSQIPGLAAIQNYWMEPVPPVLLQEASKNVKCAKL
jgi:hypothetical protein